MPETKIPALPEPNTIKDPHLRRVLAAVKEALDIRLGRRGDPLDRAVTIRDLAESGLAAVRPGANLGQAGKSLTPVAGSLAVPPSPLALETGAVFTTVNVQWITPRYGNHSHTEIWRSTEDDLSTAVMVGASVAQVYSDVGAEYNTTYYYWVRLVSTADVVGPYNATAGTEATTGIDIAGTLEALAGQIEADSLTQDLRSRIEKIEYIEDGLSQESIQRALDIAAEAQARSNALVEEAQARTSELAAETQARAAALTAEAQARADAISAEASTRNAQFLDLFDAIDGERITRAADIQAETDARVAALTAEAQARALALAAEAVARVDGIRAERDERIAQITSLSELLDEFGLGLTEETRIRQEENSYQALQVSVLLAAQENSAAAVQSLNTVYTSETEALAQNLTVVQAEIAGKASAATVQELTSRVTNAEGIATSASQAITSLQNSLLDDDGEINLDVTGVFDLNNRVENVEGNLLAQGQAITDLQSSIIDVADAEAFQLLEAKVTQNEEDIESTSVALTLLQNTLPSQIANSSVIQELTSTVIDLDGQISSVATDLTQLSTQVGSDISAAVTTLNEAISDETQARTSALQDLSSAFTDSINSEVSSLSQAISNESSSRVTAIQNLDAKFTGDVNSAVTSLNEAISDETSARVSSVNTLSAQIGDVQGAIANESTIRAEDKSFFSLVLNSQQATLDGISAAVDTASALNIAENEVIVGDIFRIDGVLDQTEASIQNIQQIQLDDREAAAQATESLTAQFNTALDAKASIDYVTSAVSTEVSNRASALAELSTSFDEQLDTKASKSELSEAISSESEARATESSNLQTQFTENINSAVSTFNQAISDETTARANAVSSLTSQIGDVEGQVIQEALIRASEDDYTSMLLSVQTAAFDNASAAITTSSEISITENGLLLENISNLQGQIGSVEGGLLTLQQVQLADNEALVSSLEQLEARVSNEVSSSITSLTEAISDETQARTTALEQLDSKFTGDISSATTTLNTAISDETQARTTALQQLDSKFTGDISSAVTTLNEAISDETQARTIAISDLSSQFSTDINSAINTLNTAVSNETTARTNAVTQLTSTLDGQSATLQTQAQTLNGLSASYVLKADVGGVVSGYGFAADAGAGSRFTIAADRFAMVAPTVSSSSAPANPHPGMVWRNTTNNDIRYRNRANTAWVTTPDTVPFVIQTSSSADAPAGVYMDTAFIRDASIDMAKIKDLMVESAMIAEGAITSFQLGEGSVGSAQIDNVIQSTNFSSTQGWRLDKHGQLTANNANIRGHINATSGTFSGTLEAGTVITDNLITTGALQADAVSNIAAVYSGGEQSTAFSWLTLAHVNIPAAIRNVVSSGRTVVCQFSFEGRCSRNLNSGEIALMAYEVQRRNTSGNYSTILEGRFRESDFTVITGVVQLASNTNRIRIQIRKITGPGGVSGRRVLINVMSLKR